MLTIQDVQDIATMVARERREAARKRVAQAKRALRTSRGTLAERLVLCRAVKSAEADLRAETLNHFATVDALESIIVQAINGKAAEEV
jgi:hypothetical protein